MSLKPYHKKITLLIFLVFFSISVYSNIFLEEELNTNTINSVSLEAKLTQDDVLGVAEYDGNFGWSVSVEANTMLVGAPNNSRHGVASIFNFNGNEWIEKETLSPNNVNEEIRFGETVLLHGIYAFIGARNSVDNGYRSGAVYVYKNNGQQWLFEAKLLANDGEPLDYFGGAISAFGNKLIIGAYGDDDVAIDSGAVYVFKNSNGQWLQTKKITVSDGGETDYFGATVLLEDNTLLVGAVFDDDNGIDSGSVYIFDELLNNWILKRKLTPIDGSAGDTFGSSLSLQDDLMVVSSYLDDENGYKSGSAYVFKLSNNQWSQTSKLLASDGQETDFFGLPVKIVNDKIAIGSIRNNNENGNNAGAVYLFSLVNETWDQSNKITTSDGEGGDRFGSSMDVYNNKLLVGAFDDDMVYASDVGSVYMFDIEGDIILQDEKIEPLEGARGENLGLSVSFSTDFAVVGAPIESFSSRNSGSVYVYIKIDNKWVVYDKLEANDIEGISNFGYSVSIQGDRILVGAPYKKAAYIFDLVNGIWTQTATLAPTDNNNITNFGALVNLYENNAFVTMSTYDSTGKVYLFELIDTVWRQTKVFENPIRDIFTKYSSNFGSSISTQKDTVVIGDTSTRSLINRAVYVYKKINDNWVLEHSIKDDLDYIGGATSISNNTLVLGSPHYTTTDSEVINSNVYIYEFINENWVETQVISGNGIKSFGSRVSISGNIAAIYSSPNEYNAINEITISLYEKEGGLWKYKNQIFFQGDPNTSAGFGSSLTIDGENILIGAPYSDEISISSGAAYIYNLNSSGVLFENSFEQL